MVVGANGCKDGAIRGEGQGGDPTDRRMAQFRKALAVFGPPNEDGGMLPSLPSCNHVPTRAHCHGRDVVCVHPEEVLLPPRQVADDAEGGSVVAEAAVACVKEVVAGVVQPAVAKDEFNVELQVRRLSRPFSQRAVPIRGREDTLVALRVDNLSPEGKVISRPVGALLHVGLPANKPVVPHEELLNEDAPGDPASVVLPILVERRLGLLL